MSARLTLSATGGAVTATVLASSPAEATSSSSAGRRPKMAAPHLGQLLCGTPNVRALRKRGSEECLRGDFELGVLFETGSKSMGDGDVHEILWMQRVLDQHGIERNRFQPTKERWPASKVWGLLETVGESSLGAARVYQWIGDDACHFSRADAESCVSHCQTWGTSGARHSPHALTVATVPGWPGSVSDIEVPAPTILPTFRPQARSRGAQPARCRVRRDTSPSAASPRLRAPEDVGVRAKLPRGTTSSLRDLTYAYCCTPGSSHSACRGSRSATGPTERACH